MVVPAIVGAAHAASAVGSAGATALGLEMGKTDLELTRELFKLQMRQAKRLWTAEWAEASARHGESCMQAAQQHAESQAMAMAAYYQAEKIASQGIKLARDQDSRAYEMSWRAEVRESLRDELTNQNNRFNIIMLCDTVCLGCVFSLVADGAPPTETSAVLLNLYLFSVGLSTMLFSISLWFAVIVVRRLHEHTAGRLERKLFAQSEDLQSVWHHQLKQNPTDPSGPREYKLVNQAYEKWVEEYLDPIAKPSIHMLSIGVVAMFVSAGLLVHAKYLIEYNATSAVSIFWSMVIITSITVIFMKYSEDRKEKKKEGVYDNSWQDHPNNAEEFEAGPFAKISKAQKQLFSTTAVGLASVERMEQFQTHERKERQYCAKTQSLQDRVESLRHEAKSRAKTRKDVLKLLTTAAEELDALPEELISRLNKMLHEVDEADHRNANFVSDRFESESLLQKEAGQMDWSHSPRMLNRQTRQHPRPPMAQYSIDAQRIPVSLGSLRKKLGEISLTTLLRLKNMSDEPLRLKSGVQLKQGRYIKSLNATDPHNNAVCYHLYPGTEIPPRAEVVIVARNVGGFVPTSGIEGELVYMNRDETWLFEISFRNSRTGRIRRCRAQASYVGGSDGRPGGGGNDSDDSSEEDADVKPDDVYWQISKDEIDRKANNEFVISFDLLRGKDATKAAFDRRQSQVILKSGFLLKNKAFGLRLQWYQRWFVLTPTEIIYSETNASKEQRKIALNAITNVRRGSDIVKENVFEIHTNVEGHEPYRLSAASTEECDDWIKKISYATGKDVKTTTDLEYNLSKEESFKNGIECVQSDRGTEVLSVV